MILTPTCNVRITDEPGDIVIFSDITMSSISLLCHNDMQDNYL